uniref:Uncharacterized protein n=1 Tax=viral metagenome TaxID=1070528 RepID=A0A6C0AXI4_9ZZZZ|tara:strand:+ start:9855 stop:10391 length:537 start_codon:yes stop_codon:yes gene_type:complete
MSHSLDNNQPININFDISYPNYESNMQPFMRRTENTDIVIDTYELEKKLLLLDNALSEEIKNFYRKIKSSTQEIYIKNWQLFSIDNILKLKEMYIKDNINITDIGLKYEGMGHCKVAFIDPKSNMIYYRHDGGSNGYDREHNYNKLKNNYLSINNSGITFYTFLQQINQDIIESDCVF